MDMDAIKKAISQDKVAVTVHASDEAAQDQLKVAEIWRSILESGELIEDYPTAQRGPCCLILAQVETRPIHIVVGYRDERGIAVLITVYRPDERPHEWSADFRRRL